MASSYSLDHYHHCSLTKATKRLFISHRADIKQYIGPPSLEARYAILKSCIDELVHVGIVGCENPIMEMKLLRLMRSDITRMKMFTFDMFKLSSSFLGSRLKS